MCLVDILARKFRLARLFCNDRSQMGEAQQPYNNRGLHHVFGRHLGEEISIGTPFL
jgi:hypothetical protein